MGQTQLSKAEWWPELEKMGEDRVRSDLASGRWGKDTMPCILAREWINHLERLRSNDSNSEQIRIARSAKKAAWAAAIAAIIAAICAVVAIVISLAPSAP